MQKAPTASVGSAQVTPALMGRDKDSREIYIVSGLVLFLAALVGAFWYYSQSDETVQGRHSPEAFNGAQVSQGITGQTETAPLSASIPATLIDTAPVATKPSDIVHDDIYFDLGRKGLTEDGKAALIRHAEFLKSDPDWGILIQGYTDQQGSMSYNRILGAKRAETVKQHLLTLGVSETAIRTMSLGEEGALCIDTSDGCRRMNRRVHLELRKVGRDHMTIPAAISTVTVTDEAPAVADPAALTGEAQGTGDSPLESAPSLPESDNAPMMGETTLPAPAQ